MFSKALTTSARVALLAAFLSTTFASTPASAVARFGTACQKSYEGSWLETLSYSYDRCGRFNNELDDTDTKIFYYSLVDAKWWWEGAGDQLTLDNVHLFYGSTHGGTSSSWSRWAMWNDQTRAYSSNMRLGNEAVGTHIFSTYACETLKVSDGHLWDRMGPIFSGGLKYATGSHDKVYDGNSTKDTGEDYADNLQKGQAIKYAWKNGNSDWINDQDVTVVATGTNASNCHSRRDNMKWQNFGGYSRLRDGQIGYICRTSWDNL